MELFSHAYEGTAGNELNISDDDFIALKSAALLKNWITKLKRANPKFSPQDFHQIMKREPVVYTDIRKNTGWGDSFIIDQVIFGTGGSHRLIDYPEIKVLYEGEIILFKDVAHRTSNVGALTFDATEVKPPRVNEEGEEYSSDSEEEVSV